LADFYTFDPGADARWSSFLNRHPAASIFHSAGWLEALRRTYGYQPIAYTTSPPGKELAEAQAFCKLNTWMSGRRLISLPFSDHAALLADNDDRLRELFSWLGHQIEKKEFRYVEIRPLAPLSAVPAGFGESAAFCWHRLCLKKEIGALYGAFHKDCVRRKIRRAEREGLHYSEGRSEELIQHFYRLLLATHQRHGLPPQPIAWYRNLVQCLGEGIKIRVAYKGDLAIASIITLTYKQTMVYKYGCSDARYHRLGGMMLLLWRAIQDAKASGLEELDLGRSDLDNAGLIKFKEHWGAQPEKLVYWGNPVRLRANTNGWQVRAARRVVTVLPKAVLPMIGRLAYKHLG
jgi:CelD/BcsL family acetyltransferase involved in cellulose biosynthesis